MNEAFIAVLILMSSVLVVFFTVLGNYKINDVFRNYSMLFLSLNQMLISLSLTVLWVKVLCAAVGLFIFVISAVKIVRKM